MLVAAGLGAYGQIQGHRPAHVHAVLGPPVRHMGQGVGVHGGLDFRIHLLRAADAGGIDGLVPQGLEAHGGVFQNVRLFLQVREGVHAAIGEDDHPAQGRDLVEHAVGGQRPVRRPCSLLNTARIRSAVPRMPFIRKLARPSAHRATALAAQSVSVSPEMIS